MDFYDEESIVLPLEKYDWGRESDDCNLGPHDYTTENDSYMIKKYDHTIENDRGLEQNTLRNNKTNYSNKPKNYSNQINTPRVSELPGFTEL